MPEGIREVGLDPIHQVDIGDDSFTLTMGGRESSRVTTETSPVRSRLESKEDLGRGKGDLFDVLEDSGKVRINVTRG